MAVRQTGTEGEAGFPEKERRRRLVELAARNAATLVLSQDKERIKKRGASSSGPSTRLESLLEKIRGIRRMEAQYDISNTWAWSPWVLWCL